MELINKKDNISKDFINESDNVIVNAFEKKTAVHAGLIDRFAPAEKT